MLQRVRVISRIIITSEARNLLYARIVLMSEEQ